VKYIIVIRFLKQHFR